MSKTGRWDNMPAGQDRHSVEAKENEVYWLCECGLARTSIRTMEEHCEESKHIAERINSETGERTGILAVGFSDKKYGTQIPDSAQINREGLKNDAMFPRSY